MSAMTPYDDVRFWMQVLGDSKRTVICSPELESRLKTQIEARGLAGLLTVVATRTCPTGFVIVIDENAIEAATR